MICNLYLSSLHFSFVPHLLFYKNHKVITDLTWLCSQFKNIMTLFDIHAVKSLLFRLFILHLLVKKGQISRNDNERLFQAIYTWSLYFKSRTNPWNFSSWILYFIWIVHPMARPVIFFSWETVQLFSNLMVKNSISCHHKDNNKTKATKAIPNNKC